MNRNRIQEWIRITYLNRIWECMSFRCAWSQCISKRARKVAKQRVIDHNVLKNNVTSILNGDRISNIIANFRQLITRLGDINFSIGHIVAEVIEQISTVTELLVVIEPTCRVRANPPQLWYFTDIISSRFDASDGIMTRRISDCGRFTSIKHSITIEINKNCPASQSRLIRFIPNAVRIQIVKFVACFGCWIFGYSPFLKTVVVAVHHIIYPDMVFRLCC